MTTPASPVSAPCCESLDDALRAGRLAISENRWADAKEAFTRALATSESAEAYEGRGLAAARLGHGPEGLMANETAFRLYRRQGDPVGAARVATVLGVEYADLRGEIAVGKGWLKRAESLLEGLPPRPELAWVKVWQGHVALVVDCNLDTASRLSAEAEALGRELGLLPVEMLARAQRGMIEVLSGRLCQGLPLLDEAATAAMAGEFDDVEAAGISACYVLHACEYVFDFERSFQWYNRSLAWTEDTLPGATAFCQRHLCRVYYWRGEWRKAEEELQRILREFVPHAPAYLPGGRIELAQLRHRQGRPDEALELLDQAEPSPLASLVRASIALERSEETRAADLVERYFRRLGPAEALKRVPGLEVLVRAHARLGDFEAAAAALEELEELTRGAGTVGLRAACAAAGGTFAMARGDADTARRLFEDAVDLYQQSGARFEAASSRAELACCLSAAGRTDEAQAEARSALAVFREIGAESDATRLEKFLDRFADPERRSCDGVLGVLSVREREVLAEVAAGRSNQEIAHRLHLSLHTVKRHVANLLAKLDLPSRTAAAVLAAGSPPPRPRPTLVRLSTAA